jgi:uncharacterized membrane protein
MPGLEQIFSHVCGQVHRWAVGGELLPFCQRCTGLYVGGAVAFLLYAFFRPRPTPRVLLIHGLLLLQMVPFGYHFVPQDGTVRTLTGQLFAIGLTYFLALNPAAQFGFWEKRGNQSVLPYGVAAFVSIAALELAVHWGGGAPGFALAWVGFLGLLVYAALVLANLVALPLAARSLFHRPEEA